ARQGRRLGGRIGAAAVCVRRGRWAGAVAAGGAATEPPTPGDLRRPDRRADRGDDAGRSAAGQRRARGDRAHRARVFIRDRYRMAVAQPRLARRVSLALAVGLLDASLAFQNLWPTPLIRWRGEFSVECGVFL